MRRINIKICFSFVSLSVEFPPHPFFRFIYPAAPHPFFFLTVPIPRNPLAACHSRRVSMFKVNRILCKNSLWWTNRHDGINCVLPCCPTFTYYTAKGKYQNTPRDFGKYLRGWPKSLSHLFSMYWIFFFSFLDLFIILFSKWASVSCLSVVLVVSKNL